jgi:alpha-L-fucosidase
MKHTGRSLFGLATGAAALRAALPAAVPKIQAGKFTPDWDSLKQYRCPDWFRDAKLGIWSVWGPECVPEQRDWYARNLHIEGHPQYKHHLETYGHPAKHGYKDIVPLWKGENWDPERLMSMYEKAGAKYFCIIAQHHDNIDCWNSKFHRWNSVNMGPEKDVVGGWRKAALKRGLRFGVTEHLGASWGWYSVSKKSDRQGPMAGVPYDGVDPKYADLYHCGNENVAPFPAGWYPQNTPESFKQEYFRRLKGLVDNYQPDLLYSDGSVPFGGYGRSLVAHFYNANTQWHGGKLEAVYNCKFNGKDGGEYAEGSCVQDLERGVQNGIKAKPWQTDTCVGDWYYKRDIQYKTATTVIQMLADIVSKNGNLPMNFPLRPDGTLDAPQEKILTEMAPWVRLNGEAIYGTRPWRVYGEGPTQVTGGHFNEGKLTYTAEDIRFTARRGTLYAIALAWPESGKLTIRSLAGRSITSVRMLGVSDPLKFTRGSRGLVVNLPASRPCDHAYVLRLEGEGV